ncbi:ATP synthase F1 subunit gamma [Marinilabilia salmonicolor]|jgi:F-type H+-transporting ATPase subunit gamma|uniref:ATP synthase gamma chain n=1 Tax=Marinilabilia salmonicolor TaxID=989 RepID=A0A2T0XR74_9BACT|nr:ATP synthase F1 subunit gamma [Marinilabilia salmonicolor]PRZ01440.1 ATP synthase F1 subcomplex gamma subunit [Marinilabilia salmonicolor]RCW31974.1 ATP synthase F1 subcomplex gamma subunit [Marinilabilia salmonicolor]
MANLKDIRTRIGAIKTTRQVTSAMKMVSAARLKKAQDDVDHIRPYTSHLLGIINDMVSAREDVKINYTMPGKGDKVVLWVIASNRGLCGAFNSNVVKAVQNLLKTDLREEYKNGDVEIRVLGKQAWKMLRARNIIPHIREEGQLVDPSFEKISMLAEELLDEYDLGILKRSIVVYNEFINAAVQQVQVQQFLPIAIPEVKRDKPISKYILEPDRQTIVNDLMPKTLRSLFYQVVLDSIASEHGARMTSMHKATDNATDLIKDLQLSYNKARQTAITNELIEITSGAEALKK